MPRVLWGETFPLKQMSQMGPAFCAFDLNSLAVRIRESLHRSRNFIVEGGPPALGVKLVLGSVKRAVASLADVSTRFEVCFVLSTKGTLGSLSCYDPFFFCCKFVQ